MNSKKNDIDINEYGLLTKEEKVFFKILLKNIDSYTGELLNLSEESILTLTKIYEKCFNFKTVVLNPTKKLSEKEKLILEDFTSGKTLSAISEKYLIPKKKLKRILCKLNVVSKSFYVCETYQESLKKQENNIDSEYVGTRWSDEEDFNLDEEYKSGKSVYEIAKIHKRKVGGIKARLVRHGFASSKREVPDVYNGL